MKKIRAKLYSFMMEFKISERDYFYPVHYGGQFITHFFKNQDEFNGYFEDILIWFYMTSERYFRTLLPYPFPSTSFDFFVQISRPKLFEKTKRKNFFKLKKN